MMTMSVDGWAAWTPGCPDREDMREWFRTADPSLNQLQGETEPSVESVPSRQLRRCSRITRMGLRAAFDCVDDSPYTADEVQLVWVTRHGEINVTIDLLEDLAGDEMLMPMAFSNSVPNTPAAYFDIAAGNTFPTRTVCGGRDSFHQGLIDATGLLEQQPDHPVLVVQADGMLPEPLDEFNESTAVPFGIGLMISPEHPEERLECRGEPVMSVDHEPEYPPALEMLRWYLGNETRTQVHTVHRRWIWSRRE